MNQRQQIAKWIVAAALYLFWPAVLLVSWGELTPRPPSWTAYFWDKSLHFIAYFGLAAMVTLVIRNRPKLFWALFGLAVFGGALEILQGFTGRDPDLHDEIANGLGVLSGYLIARAFSVAIAAGSLVGEDRRR